MRGRVAPAILLALTRGQASFFPATVTTLLPSALHPRIHSPDPPQTATVTDYDPDGSRETRRTPPRKAAFPDGRAARGHAPRAHTASATLIRLSGQFPAHRHNGPAASGIRRSMIGWRALWSSQSTQF